MKKIVVNEAACIGCGACVGIDNEHFDFNDAGLSSVKNSDNLTSENLKGAIECCPTNAISITENDKKCDCEKDNCDCSENNCGCECNCHCEHK